MAPGTGPSVYCFLPTREDSGLPFLLHGRFEVPLDRERLRRESPLNRRLLAEAGGALAALAGSLDPGRALALLGLLAGARPAPFFSAVIDEARRQLAGLPLLPAADGRRLPAPALRRAPAALAARLAGVALDEQGGAALAPAGTSVDQAAAWLGVRPFSPSDLLALLEQALDGLAEGDPARPPSCEPLRPWPPTWRGCGATWRPGATRCRGWRSPGAATGPRR